MNDANPLGFGRPSLPPRSGPDIAHVIVQHPLRRVLAFTRHSIDDVVNDPIVKNEVLGYYKLHTWVQRESDRSELERQWNPLGMRT